MATIHQVFNLLVEKRNLSLKVASKVAYENLRTRLVKLFSKQKDFLRQADLDDGSCELSVCGEWNSDTSVATFQIAKRKKKEAVEFEIVGNEDTEEIPDGN